ncbi:SNF2 family N-terminal domain protein [Synechococcus sp. PCC 7335]|uniref:DEAD/DEAH box helicase n=1 Tax=Synechococcus sp. (strain ATCC 29403 / PCC 7335) TaxID=91464 RepID=UPI00017EC3A0|nr:DEAD/DEAH box helicase [Synechococcus sp. PCC 7335]EDX87895.1 SNF2 family N-terminal domain protein [Synechococcus sp. PCC 7335]
MATLHGNWLPDLQRFFLWGETWRKANPIELSMLSAEEPTVTPATHPYQLSQAELQNVFQKSDELDLLWMRSELEVAKAKKGAKRNGKSAGRAGQRKWLSRTVVLPTLFNDFKQAKATGVGLLPVLSADHQVASAIHPWEISGALLGATTTVKLLSTLPLGRSEASDFVGDDLRYWSHLTRWCLDLLARGKFVPVVGGDKKGAIATWQLLLDSATDQTRLKDFCDRLPLICHSYPVPTTKKTSALKVDLPSASEPLIRSFLETIVDAQVRSIAKANTLPSNAPLSKDLPLQAWIDALGAEDPHFEGTPAGVVRLNDVINTWSAPLQNLTDTVEGFRTCFQLVPPASKATSSEQDWTLRYGLQAIDDTDYRVDASLIWQHPTNELSYQGRVIESPQETLLGGLGRATRLYEPIKQTLVDPSPTKCVLGPIEAFQFLKTTVWRLQDSGFGVILPDNLVDPSKVGASRLGLQISATAPPKTQRLGLQSLLNFKWDLSVGGQILTKAEFDELITQGTPLVEINGQWVELRPQDVRAAKDFFEKRKGQTKLSVEEALRISTGDNQLIDKLPVVKFDASGKLDELITTMTTGNQSLEPVTEPDGFAGQLRPYQAKGVSWLSFLEQWGLGACLADDMGLGKTVQLIAFLLYLKQENALGGPVLLVCPTSVLTNWQREVSKFAPNQVKTLVYHGDKRPKGSALVKAAEKLDLVITSYTLVQRDLKELKRVEWRGMVLDEAQNIKNPTAKQSVAVREIDSVFRIALTGTPVENRLSELWAIMDFLNPGYLGPLNFFKRRFATPIEKYGDTDSLKTLRSLVQPFILRRLKTDRSIIQDLPEKQEMTVFCGLSSEQARLYQKLVDSTLGEIDEATGLQRRGMILGLLVKLKQICNHPAQFLQQDSLGKSRRSGKLQRLDEMLEEVVAEGDRALIFTQFAEWGKLLSSHLEHRLGTESLFLYGSTSKNKREEMVDRFQLDPNGPKIFILSLKAGGVGLNLTRANHVFHFDRWWNPAVENQATDRAFRIGQTKNVQVHKFVCTGTLEERINEMINSKKALAEQVVGAGEQWLTELDTDQLRNLLLLDRDAVIDES